MLTRARPRLRVSAAVGGDELGLVEHAQPASVRLAAYDLGPGSG